MGSKRPVKLVAYYRVSTKGQGASGLGLLAQQAAVESYARSIGAEVVAFYQEVESGKRSDRPELVKALAHARRSRATLVIAKLDRLARNVHFVSGLMETGVDFVACDAPGDDRFMIHMRAVMAEEEARKIGQRTRDALAAYRAGKRVSKRVRLMYPDGVPAEVVEATAGKLGAELPQCRNLDDAARRKGGEAGGRAVAQAADDAYADLAPLMAEWRAEGLSLQAIADRLDAEGQTTRSGKPWTRMQVSRVLGRTIRA